MVKQGSYKKKVLLQLFGAIALILLANLFSQWFNFRIDLTKEGRFSLTEASKDVLANLDDQITVKVFLEGDFPAGIKRLQAASKDMLEELKARSKGKVDYQFIDPLYEVPKEGREEVLRNLATKGIFPRRLVQNEDAFSEKVFFPSAQVFYRGRDLPITLLDEQLNRGPQETINNSIAQLEYKLMNTIQKLGRLKAERIAFLEGHGELTETDVADWAASLQPYYELHRINLTGKSALDKKYELLVVAKPTKPISEADKFKIDQFIMNGGKVLWLIDNMNVSLDSLQRNRGSYLALDRGLNLDDQLFKYGLRLNLNLIQDLQCTAIPLTVGTDQNGRATEIKNFPWHYYPVITNHNNEHPVSKNMGPIMLKFAGTLDTIKTPGIKKTSLLASSPYTKSYFSPVNVDLQSIRQEPDPSTFNKKNLPVAVALEGSFTSNFKNRLSFSTQQMIDTLDDVTFRETGEFTKMIVVSDGDIAKNEIDPKTRRPNPLGYYRFTSETFANKDFLNNCVEWLLDEQGIIAAKSKDVELRMLDTVRSKEEKTFWTWLNILLPLLIVLVSSLAYQAYRKKKFTSI